MRSYVLRHKPTPTDSEWHFTLPGELTYPRRPDPTLVYGKCIKFTAEEITIQIEKFPSNRILHSDDATKFILLSFGNFRLPDEPLRVTGDYISRIFQKGIFLNGQQYRFYHHSNSQLRGRSCFVRQANSDEELDQRIYALGDFGKIMSAAKRAKRIGLLFSEAQLDYDLDPRYVVDIPDIKSGDEIFSDGCGLISKKLAIQLSKKKKIIFRGVRYTPSVYQIRYLGYKGVLMVHPELDKMNEMNKETPEKQHFIEFRASMKKFRATSNTTFSVVDHSVPYAFGRVNNDVITLLHSLGITKETLLAKQAAYHRWIEDASTDPIKAFDFLCTLQEYRSAERVLLDGIDHAEVLKSIKNKQKSEISSFVKADTNKSRTRIIVEKSRLLFGVCDPFQVLKEGQVHVRITLPHKGVSTPIYGDVLVVRNPCLHPGDCLKLRAVDHPKLSHLVDCLVFASVARPGHHAAPSMSSGGDLDGDKFFVCWDPDLVPSTVAESYDYPPVKERASSKVTRADLANYFAAYNNASLGRVAALHTKWAQTSPNGALCSECQELNALHSQSVDGGSIRIPERLQKPPDLPADAEPYITALLAQNDRTFATSFLEKLRLSGDIISTSDPSDATTLLEMLLTSKHSAVSEYELFDISLRLSRKHSFSLGPYLSYFDFGAFTAQQKHAITSALNLSPDKAAQPQMWNSLFQSDLLTVEDLFQRQLDKPFPLQRLYSSKVNSFATFFSYLRRAVQDFTRKIILIKVDERLVLGIFMRGEIPWDEDDDPEVNDNVVVCSFLPHTSSTFSSYRPCVAGYKLHCSYSVFQLYDRHLANSFVYLQRRPRKGTAESDVAASIALQKISDRVRQQVGRVFKTPVMTIEMHVVSNRDRVAHQLFDLWFEHVATENHARRFERLVSDYRLDEIPSIHSENWDSEPWMKEMFHPKQTEEDFRSLLENHTLESEWEKVMGFCIRYHRHEELYWTFLFVVSRPPLDTAFTLAWLQRQPSLVFALLKQYPPNEGILHTETRTIHTHILQSIIRSANQLGMASLVALEKLSITVSELLIDDYVNLLWLSALSVRSPNLVQEIMLVLNDARAEIGLSDPVLAYGHKYALGIAFDRAEEAADECPCDDNGVPRRQRIPPSQTKLTFLVENYQKVKATLRVDAKNQIRLHSHVRLSSASREESLGERVVIDGIVIQASRGEVTIDLMYPAPPETERIDWSMYNAGSIATSRAMLDALLRLLQEKDTCCLFYKIITADQNVADPQMVQGRTPLKSETSTLNPSQLQAVESCYTPLCLIWGPPGTGKTTVVIQILRKLIGETDGKQSILMTASTHNAVDNVLERFVKMNETHTLLQEDQILRVATDISKVNKDLHQYTIDARVGGDMNENNRLFKQAQQRVKAALIVFTTCAGAGLGILRNRDFEIALIDEASQITEPTALIPLVKGVQRAVLVGDHVQLRPTVKNVAKALLFDVSLLERLWSTVDNAYMSKTMLEIQYRFPQELAEFPSYEFYEGRLRSGIKNSQEVLIPLLRTSFPWPITTNNQAVPTVFVPCTTEEDMGGRSKSNTGQVEIVLRILKLLTRTASDTETEENAIPLTITILSPYSRQVTELRHRLPSSGSVKAFTVDSFQGREADIIVFTSVRCNAEGDIGFVDDARRLNVMWTRARLGLIIVGDRRTMSTNPLWKRAIDSCREVNIPDEETDIISATQQEKVEEVDFPLILVTGASGFLGSHIVAQLLEHKYRVRVTCPEDMASRLKSIYIRYGDSFETLTVTDLSTHQFFDTLVGVHAVVHTSYPRPQRGSEGEILKAAENGLLNIVRQSRDAKIQRIVITSSIASVSNAYGSFTDQDWNPIAEGVWSASEAGANKMSVYKAAKILAEKRLWEYAQAHPEIDITTFNIPAMFGPFSKEFILKPSSTAMTIPYHSLSTNAYIYQLLNEGKAPSDPYYIDVRDVAKAHVLALKSPLSSEDPAVGMKRLIMSALNSFDLQSLVELVRDRRPELADRLELIGAADELSPMPFDVKRIEKVLGVRGRDLFTSFATTILDTIDSLVELESVWQEKGFVFR